jgi:cyanate lyase
MRRSKQTCKKYQTVLTVKPRYRVRSRSAFLIARRAKELGLELSAVAQAIGRSDQYARDLLQGSKIPSDETIRRVIQGLNFDDFEVDQIRTISAEDRLRSDSRYQRFLR